VRLRYCNCVRYGVGQAASATNRSAFSQPGAVTIQMSLATAVAGRMEINLRESKVVMVEPTGLKPVRLVGAGGATFAGR
jgi:hypothetical protein